MQEWQDLQFKVDSELQIFEKLFMAILFALRVLPEISWEEVAKEILSYFRFDVWLDLRLISQHTLY